MAIIPAPSLAVATKDRQESRHVVHDLSAAITELFAALLIVVVFLFTDWSPWTSVAVGLPAVAVFAYWSLPRFSALWVAIEYLTDRGNQEPWTRDGA